RRSGVSGPGGWPAVNRWRTSRPSPISPLRPTLRAPLSVDHELRPLVGGVSRPSPHDHGLPARDRRKPRATVGAVMDADGPVAAEAVVGAAEASVDGVIADESFHGEDWYGEPLADRAYTRCTFTDVDLTEAHSRGTVFEECHFSLVRFNASRHTDSAFLRCTFQRATLFEATFTGCKLTGSTFDQCELRPLRITGGDWSFVGLAGADLRGVRIEGTR